MEESSTSGSTERVVSLWQAINFSPTTSIANSCFAVGLLIALLLCAWKSGPQEGTRRSNYIMLFLGLVVGWIATTLLLPYNILERQIYSGIGSAVGTFLSGYVVSKLDGVWNIVLFKKGDQESLNHEGLRVVAFFLVGLSLSSATIFTNRSEWLETAVQCNPYLYGGSNASEIASVIGFNKKSCEKLGLPYAPDTLEKSSKHE